MKFASELIPAQQAAAGASRPMAAQLLHAKISRLTAQAA